MDASVDAFNFLDERNKFERRRALGSVRRLRTRRHGVRSGSRAVYYVAALWGLVPLQKTR